MEKFTFLQEKAYLYLRNQIFEDRLQYETIYSETQIANELGCSRTPVKDALTRLRHDKYIDIIPSKGFILHRLTPEDILITFQTRVAIEAFCVINIMKNLSTPTGATVFAQLQSIVGEQRTFAEQNNIDKFLASDIKFHREIIFSTSNSDFHEMYDSHIYRIEKLASKSLQEPGRCTTALLEHQAILDAISSQSMEKCYQAVELHNKSTYECDIRILTQNMDTTDQ